jgi:hypothetical protein
MSSTTGPVTLSFAGIRELLEFLERERASDEYLCRGQTKRYDRHTWKTPDRTLEIEAVYPQDYRFFYYEHEPTETTAFKVSAAREFGRDVRDQFFQFLAIYLTTIVDRDAWAKSQLASLEALPAGAPLSNSLFQTCASPKLTAHMKSITYTDPA